MKYILYLIAGAILVPAIVLIIAIVALPCCFYFIYSRTCELIENLHSDRVQLGMKKIKKERTGQSSLFETLEKIRNERSVKSDKTILN